MVAASRAHPTSATANNPYLYAQIYTALMYLIAAGCAWFLRAWKIGQMEMISKDKGDGIPIVNHMNDGVGAGQMAEGSMCKSSLFHRLFVFKRV